LQTHFLQDLALVMGVAGVVTVLCHLLRQPVVLGYLAAGVLIGPHTQLPLLVRDVHTVEIMAELGVVLLMFSLGLHFSLRNLAAVGATAFVAAAMEILLMLLIGYATGRLFGWGRMDSIFLGAILSISSTTIITKALGDLGMMKEHFATLIFGILVVEDILAIAMIAVLSGIAKTGSLALGEVATTFGGLGIFLTSVMVVGLLLVPPLLRYVNRFKSNEMLLVAALGLCFGVSLLAVKLGYSVALGAFLIGAIVAEARERGKIEALIEPVRDMFSAVFFVAIGMLIEPQMLVKHAVPIAVITAAVVVGKVLTCAFGAFAAGNDLRTSLRVGMGLAQIGEFSFIIASLGLTLKVTSDFLYPIAVTVSALTTLLTPYLIRASDPVTAGLVKLAPGRVVSYIELYSRWMSERGDAAGEHEAARIRKLLRRWVLQIALNGVLAAAVLAAASAVARDVATVPWIQRLPYWTGGHNTIVWLGAMLMVFPLMIVSFRKLHAAAMLVSEQMVRSSEAGLATSAIRGMIASTILTTGFILISLSVLLMSSAFLPPWPVLVSLLLWGAGLALLMWRRFERMYARAQVAIKATLTRPREPAHAPHGADHGDAAAAPAPAPLHNMLRQAELENVVVATGAPAAGKLIRELQLRSRTGASVVGIERDGAAIVNPGPDEELQPQDGVLLLGTRRQLEAARTLLRGTAAAA
jgi:CPA2 family monovalent cation:H+ antiporter-2